MALSINQVSANEAIVRGDAHLIRRIVDAIHLYSSEAVTANCGGGSSTPHAGLPPTPTMNFGDKDTDQEQEHGNPFNGNAPQAKHQQWADRELDTNRGTPTEGLKPSPAMF